MRAAIAVAEADPSLKIALVSKVYPMRSHTVAAEAAPQASRSPRIAWSTTFMTRSSSGDWLCEQDVVEYFVEQAPKELTQLEHWGCPWSRTADGHVNVRLRRHEDRADLVRGRQDRLPHSPHPVPDLDQVPVDQAFRRALLRSTSSKRTAAPRAW